MAEIADGVEAAGTRRGTAGTATAVTRLGGGGFWGGAGCDANVGHGGRSESHWVGLGVGQDSREEEDRKMRTVFLVLVLRDSA